VPKISTGDMLRDAVSSGSDLGHHVKETVARGELVSDDVIVALVKARLAEEDSLRGVVLDGFPRTVTQAQALDVLLNGAPLAVVEIRVPDDELVRRVRGRRICERCGTTVSAFDGDPALAQACRNCGGRLVQRSDDSEQVVRDRLKVYWRETQPMIGYYENRPTFWRVDGAQAPVAVYEAIADAVAAMTMKVKGEKAG
jgi:adenylate kinase